MTSVDKKNSVDIFFLLPVMAVCVDLFTPYLIWKNILPSPIRWLSHAAVAVMILVSIFRMIVFDRILRSIWYILAISIVWAWVAIGHGQGIVPTIWGVWLLFQFPFVCIFMYLQPNLPVRLAWYLRAFCLVTSGMELAMQILQYAWGVTPGDDLSGLFGQNGTGNAVLYAIFVCCVFFGHWIASKQWKGLVTALFIGMFSSVLGEMKVFFPAIAVIGLMATIIYAIKYQTPGKMFLYLSLIIIILVSFVFLYDRIVPGATQSPLQTYITNPAKSMEYLNTVNSYTNYSDIGRMAAVRIGWNSLQSDPLTFLFGYGIGTRSESQSLGTAGVALTTGGLGLSVGTSLLVMMQEMGIIGLTLLASFLLWVFLTLIHDIWVYPVSQTIGLRYALLLFTIMWPVWLFYAATWTERVPMLLCWFSLGYVLADSYSMRRQAQLQRRVTMMAEG